MHKIVNGKRVELTAKEALAQQALWDAQDAKVAEKRARFGYIDKRAGEYPAIEDQLDAILKQLQIMRETGQQTDTDLAMILDKWQAVKDKYPKPE